MAQILGAASARTDEAAAVCGNAGSRQFRLLAGGNAGENVHDAVPPEMLRGAGNQRRNGNQHDDVVKSFRRERGHGRIEFGRRREIAGIHQLELDAAFFGNRPEQLLHMGKARIVHIRHEDAGGTVLVGDGKLRVHLSHRAGAAGQPADAALPDGASDVSPVCPGKIRAGRALIEPALIMDAADVEHPVFRRIVADETDAGPGLPGFRRAFALGARAAAEEDVVVLRSFGKRGGGADLDAGIGLCDFRSEVGRRLHQRDGGGFRFRKQRSEFILRRVRSEDKEHVAAVRGFDAVPDQMAGQDAGPGFQQRRDGGGHRIRDRQKITAFVPVQDLLIDDAVLRHAAVQGIAVGETDAVDINIRLNDVAAADPEPVLNLRTDLDNAHHGLVTGNHGIFLQVFGDHARMRFAGADQLHIGEAESDRLDLNQQFVIRDFRHGKDGRFVVFAEIFKSGAEQLPCQNFLRHLSCLFAHCNFLAFSGCILKG